MATGQRAATVRSGRTIGRLIAAGWHRTSIHRAPVTVWLPALLVVLAVLIPIGYLFIRGYAGGQDLIRLLWRERTLTLVQNTLVLTLIVTTGSVLIAVPLAWLLARTDLPLRRLWASLTVLPLAIPSYVGALVIIAALGPRGILQGWLEPFGVERLPDIYGLFGASVVLILLVYPYVLITVNAAIAGIDRSYEEAARSMGYGPWRTFFSVNVPLLRPAIAAGGLLVALYTVGEFGAVALLRYDTFTRAIYVQYTNAFDRSLAAGLSLLLVSLTLIVLFIESRVRGLANYHWSSAGGGRTQQRVKLGGWKYPALLYCGLVVLFALIMPVGVLLYWLVRGVRAGEPLRLVWDAALSSFTVSSLAALASVICAAPIVIFAVRYRGKMSRALERLSYAGYALPGIVIALSLVFFGANYATWIYRTTAMLVFAYVIRFLPQAVGAMRASLLQVSPSVEEAARSLGYSGLKVWFTVTAPLIRRGILAGAALVFLTVMKELPVTLLLRPIGFDTLATRIWSATQEGFWARAAAPALLLILISSLSMFFLSAGSPDQKKSE